MKTWEEIKESTNRPLKSIKQVQAEVHQLAFEKGWWSKYVNQADVLDIHLINYGIPEKLALIHSEVSEALECYRDGEMGTVADDKLKPVGFPTELADIVIRVMDLAEALGIDLDAEIQRKHEFNKTRPHRHGGKAC